MDRYKTQTISIYRYLNISTMKEGNALFWAFMHTIINIRDCKKMTSVILVGGGYPQRFMRLTDFYWLFFEGEKVVSDVTTLTLDISLSIVLLFYKCSVLIFNDLQLQMHTHPNSGTSDLYSITPFTRGCERVRCFFARVLLGQNFPHTLQKHWLSFSRMLGQ